MVARPISLHGLGDDGCGGAACEGFELPHNSAGSAGPPPPEPSPPPSPPPREFAITRSRGRRGEGREREREGGMCLATIDWRGVLTVSFQMAPSAWPLCNISIFGAHLSEMSSNTAKLAS